MPKKSRLWKHMAEGSSPLKDKIWAVSCLEIVGKSGQCPHSRQRTRSSCMGKGHTHFCQKKPGDGAYFIKVILGHSVCICVSPLHPSHFCSFIQQLFSKIPHGRIQAHRDGDKVPSRDASLSGASAQWGPSRSVRKYHVCCYENRGEQTHGICISLRGLQ